MKKIIIKMYLKSGRRKITALSIIFNLNSIFLFNVEKKGSNGKILFLKKNLNEMSYFQKIKSKILQIATPMNM